MLFILYCVFSTYHLSYADETSPIYFIVAPNILHVDTEEIVTLTTYGLDEDVDVQLSLTDFPKHSAIHDEKEITIPAGGVVNATIRLPLKALPQIVTEPFYVSLVAESTSPSLAFRQEVPLLVDNAPGVIFIQSDKPVYTPGQSVNLRIVSLNDQMLPAKWPVQISILNPDGVAVSRSVSEGGQGFIKDSLKIPDNPIYGNWTVESTFYNGLKTSAKIRFEVKEYVLPTFAVSFKVAEEHRVIVPDTEDFHATVSSVYVFGKPVRGHVTVTYGLVWHGHVFPMGKQRNIKLNDTGLAEFHVKTEDVKLPVESVWFPNGGRLYLEAEVTEEASGKVEHGIDQSVVFAETAYVFKFTRSSRYFKPGLPYILQVDLIRANGEAARGTMVVIEGEAAVREESVAIHPWNTKDRKHFRTDDNGRLSLDYRLPKSAKNIRFMLKTKTRGLAKVSETVAHFGASPYFSPSDTYMLVKAEQTTGGMEHDIPSVGDFITVETTNTNPVDLNVINLMVVSRGRVVMQAKTRNLGGARTQFHFPITPDMSPNVRLLAFSIRELQTGSEVIADSTWMDVEETCVHEIVMNDDLGRRQFYRPGDTGTLTLKARPGMRIGLLAVDKAVYYLKNKRSLSRATVFDALKQQDRGCGRGGGRDSAKVFQDAGLAVLTNAGLRTEPRAQKACPNKYVRRKREEPKGTSLGDICCEEGSSVLNATLAICYKFGSMVKNGTKSEECAKAYFKCCKHLVENPHNVTESGRITKAEDIEDSDLDLPFGDGDVDVTTVPLRSNFPEAWWFEDYDMGEDDSKKIDFNLPDSVTTWVVQSLGVSDKHAFCVGRSHNITAFKNFFVHLDLPFSAIRLEQLEVRATVYNYMDRDVTVKMYLSSEEGMCYSGQPGENSEVARLDVPAKDASSVSFPIIPLEVGDYPVRVVAFSPWGYDAVEKTLRVEGEGLEKIHTVSVMLDPTGKRLVRDVPHNESYNLKTAINKQEGRQKIEVDLQLPQETIPKTDTCSVSAIGDLLGPTITTIIKGLHNLLRLPTGCGEQNLIFLGPNVFVLRYLRAANRLPRAVEKKARTYIREGINRQLTFRKPDGSYGTWPNAESSTWLTAFALKTFTQANEFVAVDPMVTCIAFEWLLLNQNEDGSFNEKAWVMHKDMMGGVNGDATLTAFVLVSLMESECIPMSRNLSEEIRRRAVEFLELEMEALDRPLAVAMTAYALALALSPERYNAFEKLKALAQSSSDGHTFWPAGEIQPIMSPIQQHGPLWYAKRPGALAVETTSYALLAYLEHGLIKETHSIVSWLIGQREAHGSFVSTQDTVLGLQALSEYSIRTYSSILDMTCDLRSDIDDSFKESIFLQHEDALLLKTVHQVPTGGKLLFEAAGTGVGMMQVEVRFNVPDEDNTCRFDVKIQSTTLSHMLTQFFWQKGKEECEPCSLDCDEEEETEEEEEDIENFTFPSVVPRIQDKRRKMTEDNKSHFSGSRIGRPFSRIGKKPKSRRARSLGISARVVCIEVCVRYQGSRETGMSVVDVGLFTGYKPVESDLKALVTKGKIQHYEHSQRSVIFYVEEISHKKDECLKFRAKQNHVVDNIQPAKVQVYDYYNPDERCTKFYKTDNASGQLANFCDTQKKICQCLEGRCGRCENVWYGQKWQDYVAYSCQNATNVMTVKILDEDSEKAGFIRYLGVVQQDIYQVGQHIEARKKVILLKRSSCRCPRLQKGKMYVMMLREPKKFVDIEGNEVHAFLVDQKALAVEYYRLRDRAISKSQKHMARQLRRTIRRLARRGCKQLKKSKKGKENRKEKKSARKNL